MDKEEKYIRDLFRREFENYEVPPSEKVWKQVRADLFRKQFTQFRPGSLNIYYLSAFILTGLAIIFALTAIKNSNRDIPFRSDQQLEMQNTRETVFEDIQGNQTNIPESDKRKNESSDQSEKRSHPGKSFAEPEKMINQESKPANGVVTEPSKQNLLPLSSLPKPDIVPYAYFTISVREGCAPLKVNFKNHSENATIYSWSFGDGGISADKEPSYIFDKPGTYFINLTVTSSEGDMSIFTDSVHVHPLPEVHFRVDSDAIPGSGQPVYFYNYSQGADYFEWNFGDGSTSNVKEPSHYYQRSGNYDICLVARTFHGCSDSLLIKNAFTDKMPEIKFPNAFTPNRNGPSNGHYNTKDPGNDIFHPVTDEEVQDYQLKIFNRNGILIFESNDINVGWDGYYHQELQPQGVYVWKARGRFSNGSSFVKMGDVTLIWTRE